MDPVVPTWSDLIQNLPWAFYQSIYKTFMPFECRKYYVFFIHRSLDSAIFFLGFYLYLDTKKLIDSRAILFCLFFE
ncbi:MAG: hypothetical protein IPP53_15425 [Bacteroidetes bacterium]|nr:hypothetical protein [Bacteroidota bacterium]